MADTQKAFTANEWFALNWELVEEARKLDPSIPFPVRYQQVLTDLQYLVAS